jgi:sugar phosphate isomerase/epimerase
MTDDLTQDRPTRREFIGSAAVAASALAASPALGQMTRPASTVPKLCLFSKPLHNRPFRELPAILNKLGIDAVDLTCRPRGHVLPERVADDLPRAVGLLREAGIEVPMITTGITHAGRAHAETIVKTAADLDIRYLKLGYFLYHDLNRLTNRLTEVKGRLRDIVALCRQYHIRAGFHNHCGNVVGAPMWDLWHLIEDLPPQDIGSFFDVRHAAAEGGAGGWRIGLHLLALRIIMLAVKDFVWTKSPSNGWRIENVPIGQGMAPIEEALWILKQKAFNGPLSLHMEYGDRHAEANSGEEKANLSAIRADWTFMRKMLHRVGYGS